MGRLVGILWIFVEIVLRYVVVLRIGGGLGMLFGNFVEFGDFFFGDEVVIEVRVGLFVLFVWL